LAASACLQADETVPANSADAKKKFRQLFTSVSSSFRQFTVTVTRRKVAGTEVMSLRPLVF
jgi:hypothetical protein